MLLKWINLIPTAIKFCAGIYFVRLGADVYNTTPDLTVNVPGWMALTAIGLYFMK